MFAVEPADLAVGTVFACGKDARARPRCVAEIGGEHVGWETTDGRDFGVLHTRQFCNFASGPHGRVITRAPARENATTPPGSMPPASTRATESCP